jgi:serine/threonine protein kinase
MDTGFDPDWVHTLEPADVYKHDARSRVWRIDAPGGRSFVVKRFEYNPLRQLLALLLRIHPGQREKRAYAWLTGAGVRVVRIVAAGVSRRGLGVCYWLATPYVGKSLHNLIYHDDLNDAASRSAVLEAAGGLTADLIHYRVFNRDHKASNILIDQDRQAWLIDYGATRRLDSPDQAGRMFTSLRANLTEAGATEADLDRLEQASRLHPDADPIR